MSVRPGVSKLKYRGVTLPLIIEKDGDGFYIVEYPLLERCYTQGKTIDEALRNIWEVIGLTTENGRTGVTRLVAGALR